MLKTQICVTHPQCVKLAVWAHFLQLNSVCPLLVSHCTNCARLVSRWPHYWLISYPILPLI